MRDVQISAFIPEDVRDAFERFARSRGLKKNFVIERALRHHLLALQEIPEEFIIPPTLVVTRKAFDRILQRLKSTPRPTAKLRRLMRGDSVSDDGLH